MAQPGLFSALLHCRLNHCWWFFRTLSNRMLVSELPPLPDLVWNRALSSACAPYEAASAGTCGDERVSVTYNRRIIPPVLLTHRIGEILQRHVARADGGGVDGEDAGGAAAVGGVERIVGAQRGVGEQEHRLIHDQVEEGEQARGGDEG